MLVGSLWIPKVAPSEPKQPPPGLAPVFSPKSQAPNHAHKELKLNYLESSLQGHLQDSLGILTGEGADRDR